MLYSGWVWPRKWGSRHPQIPVKEDSGVPRRGGHPHPSALISHRLNSWWVQLREWWLPSCTHSRRHYPRQGKTKLPSPSLLLSQFACGSEVPCWEQQAEKTWGYCSPTKPRCVEQECHSEKEATVAAPSAEAVAQIVLWREKAISLESNDTEERKERRKEGRNKERCRYSEQNVGEVLA